jgi:hypothetical protein
MKAISTLLFLGLLWSFQSPFAHAQHGTGAHKDDDDEAQEVRLPRLPKDERREWKARLRELEPEEYKLLVEKNEASETNISKKTTELLALQKQLVSTQEELAKAKAAQTVAVAAPVVAMEEVSKESYTAREKEVSKGILFKVQIGSFRNKNLAKYLDKHPNFSGDTDADGKRRYTLGSFTDYWEADNFKKYLREMGVSDAWTVAYRDGKRVALRDVLVGAAGSGVGMN